MRERGCADQGPSERPVLDMLGRVAPNVTAAIGVLTALVSAITVHLVLNRPLDVADALVEPRLGLAFQALAGLVLAALRDLLGYL